MPEHFMVVRLFSCSITFFLVNVICAYSRSKATLSKKCGHDIFPNCFKVDIKPKCLLCASEA